MTGRRDATVVADVLVEDERGVISVPVRGIPIGEHLLVHCRRGEWVMTHRTTGSAAITPPTGMVPGGPAGHASGITVAARIVGVRTSSVIVACTASRFARSSG